VNGRGGRSGNGSGGTLLPRAGATHCWCRALLEPSVGERSGGAAVGGSSARTEKGEPRGRPLTASRLAGRPRGSPPAATGAVADCRGAAGGG
jgi:hypothetical protein